MKTTRLRSFQRRRPARSSSPSLVLEFESSHAGLDFAELKPLLPVLLSYVLSFIYVGICWNNTTTFVSLYRTHVRRRHPLGKSAPALLALAFPIHHRLGLARTHLASTPTARLRIRPPHGRRRLLRSCKPPSSSNKGPDSLLAAAIGNDWKRKTLRLSVTLLSYHGRVREPMDFPTPYSSSSPSLWLVPDPAHRARLGSKTREGIGSPNANISPRGALRL